MDYDRAAVPETASVHLYRTGGEGTNCHVLIDGIHVGKILPHGQAVFPVTPGAHRIQLRMPVFAESIGSPVGRSAIVDFHASPGERISFGCAIEITESLGGRRRRQGSKRYALSRQDGTSLASELRVLEIRQTTRFDEALGHDVRIIDNQSSPAPVTRTLKASREWTRTLTVAEDRHRAVTAEVGASLLWLSAKASIEQELQHSLSLAIGVTHLFEEEITVTVPERTAVRVILEWKRIWQRGHARILLSDGSTHDVPYQVVVSVTFDQRIESSSSPAGGEGG